MNITYLLWGIEGVNRTLTACNPVNIAHILARFSADLGEGHDINSPLLIHNADGDYSNLSIGRYCHLGRDVFLDLAALITIEDRVTISMRAMLITHTDVGQSPLRNLEFPPGTSPVLIKHGAYIGAGAIVLQGVTIGECAVVGAGAVVVDDIPARSVAVGVPATVIRELSNHDPWKPRAAKIEHN